MEIKAEPVHCSFPDLRAKQENLKIVNAFIKQETDDDCQEIYEENLINMNVKYDLKREFPDVVHEGKNFIVVNSVEALHEKLFTYNPSEPHIELKTLKEEKPPDICLGEGTHKPNLKFRIVSLKKGKPNTSSEAMKLATAGCVLAEVKVCNMCGFEATGEQSMYEHMNLHTGKKPYKCTPCGFETAFMKHLKAHLKTHTRSVYKYRYYRSYECDLCEFKTINKSAFDCHICIRPHKRKIQKIKCRYVKDCTQKI